MFKFDFDHVRNMFNFKHVRAFQSVSDLIPFLFNIYMSESVESIRVIHMFS